MSIKKVVRIDTEIYAVELNYLTDIEEVQKRFYCTLYSDCTLSGKQVYVYSDKENPRQWINYGEYLVREKGLNFVCSEKEFHDIFKVLE